MSRAKQNVAWAAMAIVIVCLIMAFTGCDKKPEPVPVDEGPLLSDAVDALHGQIEVVPTAEEETQPVWGKGDLPAEYQEFFGDSNGARLDFMQNQVIENQGKILKIIAVRLLALEGVDPNDMPVVGLKDGVGPDKIEEAPGG